MSTFKENVEIINLENYAIVNKIKIKNDENHQNDEGSYF